MKEENKITLLFIRHGKTIYNIEKRYMGRTDLPLSPRGEEEIRAIFDNRSEGPGSVLDSFYEEGIPFFSSPLKRALDTAAVMVPDRAPEVMDGLKEMDFGDFEGKTWEELEKLPEYRAFIESSGAVSPPGGEEREVFVSRVWGAFRECCDRIRQSGHEKGLIVAHGGTIMALMHHLDGGSYYDYLPDNGHGYLLELDGDNRLISFDKI